MRILQQLIFVMLCLLGAWLPTSSYASFPTHPSVICGAGGGCSYWEASIGNGSFYSGQQDSALHAQLATLAKLNAANSPHDWVNQGATNDYMYVFSPTGYQGYYITSTNTVIVPTQICPGNATQVNAGSCTCNAGLVEDYTHTSCITVAAQRDNLCFSKSGTSAGQYSAPFNASLGLSGDASYTYLCEGGCEVNVSYSMAYPPTRYGQGTFDGKGCTADPASTGTGPGAPAPSGSGLVGSGTATPGAAAPTPCKAGEYSGSVNGATLCVKASGSLNVVVAGPTIKDLPPDAPAAGASGPAAPIPNAPPGTVKAVDETVCTGSSCTTTTSYKDASGASTGSTTKTQTAGAFCTANPSSDICAGATSPGNAASGAGGSGVSTPATDSALPGKPTLYTAKYPNGIAGVWADKKTALMATPLLGLTSSMMPNIPAGMAGPSFSVPVAFLGHDFGVYQVGLPDNVWQFLKWCVIITALFLARGLIFGG